MKPYLIVNVSRRETGPPPELIDQFHTILRNHQVEYKLVLSDSLTQMKVALEEARQAGFTSVWFGGGDGTVNKGLNLLAAVNWNPPIGVIPLGTMNTFAHAVGLPLQPAEAVEFLLQSHPVPFDLATVADHRFLCFASVGFHDAVFHTASPDIKKRSGKLAFWISGMKRTAQFHNLPHFVVEFPVENTEPLPKDHNPSEADLEDLGTISVRDTGCSLILSNTCNYAGFGFAPEDKACALGSMDLHLFRRRRLQPMLDWYLALRHGKNPGTVSPAIIRHYKLRECVVRSKHALSVQADGEPLDIQNPKEVHFKCLPKAMSLLFRPCA